MSRWLAKVRSKDKRGGRGWNQLLALRSSSDASMVEANRALVSLPQEIALPHTPATGLSESTLAEPARESSVSQSDVPGLQVRLWNEAYETLKKKHPKLVDAYEVILSSKIQNEQLLNDANQHGENIISENSVTRSQQMERLVRAELERTEKVASVQKAVNEGIQIIKRTKEVIASALQSVPQAAGAWAGVSLALEIISNPLSESQNNRSGIEYILMRMEWYWNFVLLLLDENLNEKPTANVQREVEKVILHMYEKVLLYQIKTICAFQRHWIANTGRNILKMEDWDGKLHDVKDAEVLVEKTAAQYNSEFVKIRLKGLLQIAKSQEEQLRHIHSAIQGQSQLQAYQLSEIHSAIKQDTHSAEKRALDDKDMECLRDLGDTDPRADKARIEEAKGGLLKDSYIWITEHADFKQLLRDPQSQVLWIKGDPGKGKTMLLCGIIDELQKMSIASIAYFFCQETNSQLNNATAVLRGIIFLLASQNPSLLKYVRRQYDLRGSKLFDGANVFTSLKDIFQHMINSPDWEETIIVVDALDECDVDRVKLLDFFAQTTELANSNDCSLKWVVSSRNWIDIEERLRPAGQTTRLQLELNQDLVSLAVQSYISHKTDQLAKLKHYDDDMKSQVTKYLSKFADGTFLWVALVCEKLALVVRRNTISALKTYPAGLDKFYARMLKDVEEYDDPDVCKDILRTAAIVYKPLSLDVFGSLLASLKDFNQSDIIEAVGFCGSFLAIKGKMVYFIHQSAKEFLLKEEMAGIIFPSGIANQHYTIFTQSLTMLTDKLRQDMYNMQEPGTGYDMKRTPNPDPLIPIHYSCCYWADHLGHAMPAVEALKGNDLLKEGRLDRFMREKFLFWIEALALDYRLGDGLIALSILLDLVPKKENPELFRLVVDADRFLRHFKDIIGSYPLQVYVSGLLLSPERSVIRQLYQHLQFAGVSMLTPREADWSSCLQSIDYLYDGAIAALPGNRLVSCYDKNTIHILDVITSDCIQALEGHIAAITSIVASPDGETLVSGSMDGTVKIWANVNGKCAQNIPRAIHTAEGRILLAIASDGKYLATASSDDIHVKMWDMSTLTCVHNLVHPDMIGNMAFVQNDESFASCYGHTTVRLWDVASGQCKKRIRFSQPISGIAASSDGWMLACAVARGTIHILDLRSWKCTVRIQNNEFLGALTFSTDNKYFFFATSHGSIKIWDLVSGCCAKTLEGHGGEIDVIAPLHDGLRLASSSHYSIKIWDLDSVDASSEDEHHNGPCSPLAVSRDSSLMATTFQEKSVQLLDTALGIEMQTLEGHSSHIRIIVFSCDGRRLGTAADCGTVKIWDTSSRICLQTIKTQVHQTTSMAFSPNNQNIMLVLQHHNIQIWSTDTGRCLDVLNMDQSVNCIEYTPDGLAFASSHDDKVILWDIKTKLAIHEIKERSKSASAIRFSKDSQRIAVVYEARGIVTAWNLATETVIDEFRDYSGCLSLLTSWLDDLGGPYGKNGSSAIFIPELLERSRISIAFSRVQKDGQLVLSLPSNYQSHGKVYSASGTTVSYKTTSGRAVLFKIDIPPLEDHILLPDK